MELKFEKEFSSREVENEGVWIDYRSGSRVKIARLGNKEFQKLYDLKLKPHKKAARRGEVPTHVLNDIANFCMSRAVLINWEGFSKDGKTLKYSPEAAYELLSEYRDFSDDIADLASDQQHFHEHLAEDSEKNS